MICDNCKIDRLVSDFIKNQKYCYRCEYQQRLLKTQNIKGVKKNFCRMCAKEIPRVKDLKKRQRTVYCSEKCSLEGHKDICSKFWTRQVRIIGC